MSCASYSWGPSARALPGGYKEVAIPIFINQTQEVGIEVYFTNALIQEIMRSGVAKVVDDETSDVKIVGELNNLQYEPSGPIISDPKKKTNYLPQETVLASAYNTVLTVTLKMIRRGDSKELWTGTFRGERSYGAPRVTLSGVNSVNPLYNMSARRINIEAISGDVMAEAYDRLTENF